MCLFHKHKGTGALSLAWSRTRSVGSEIAALENDCLCVKRAPLIPVSARSCDEEVGLRFILLLIFNFILLFMINEMVFKKMAALESLGSSRGPGGVGESRRVARYHLYSFTLPPSEYLWLCCAEEMTLFGRRATLTCVFCVGMLFVKGSVINI